MRSPMKSISASALASTSSRFSSTGAKRRTSVRPHVSGETFAARAGGERVVLSARPRAVEDLPAGVFGAEPRDAGGVEVRRLRSEQEIGVNVNGRVGGARPVYPDR